MRVLVLNAGSSSIKFSLFDMTGETTLVAGEIERIGEPQASSRYRVYTGTDGVQEVSSQEPVQDHATGLQRIFALLRDNAILSSMHELHAIGHRVVHGGDRCHAPGIIDAPLLETIRAMIPLAPLHNPANLAGIEAAQRLCPQVAQVAVFDTAFFHALPAHVCRYALPQHLYQHHRVRRYGFHGTSHQYVATAAAQHLQRPLTSLRLITLHLGNGASAAAIHGGVCIDTSMGMTPLEGLIMGTRCGDLDPALHFYLTRELGMEWREIETLLNQESGMKGLCGESDLREVHRLAEHGDAQAQLALDMYAYRISKYIGAYTVALGGLDALVFTAGVGENDERVRADVCARLAVLGIHLDQQRNHSSADGIRDISTDGSAVRVLVIPTNEELEIARQTLATIQAEGQ